jgi:hypothetical protein
MRQAGTSPNQPCRRTRCRRRHPNCCATFIGGICQLKLQSPSENRMYVALDRRLWPQDQTDLYMLLGCLNCLMAAGPMTSVTRMRPRS